MENVFSQTPEPQDSGIGKSLQDSEASSTMDMENIFPAHSLMRAPPTPPSKYLWNRAEYQNNYDESSIENDSYMSFDDDYSLTQISLLNKFESTQIDINKSTLADNMSMRQQSIIESPMFFDDKIFSSPIEGFDSMGSFPRSSPFSKRNCSVLNDLNLSPIKSEKDVEEEFM